MCCMLWLIFLRFKFICKRKEYTIDQIKSPRFALWRRIPSFEWKKKKKKNIERNDGKKVFLLIDGINNWFVFKRVISLIFVFFFCFFSSLSWTTDGYWLLAIGYIISSQVSTFNSIVWVSMFNVPNWWSLLAQCILPLEMNTFSLLKRKRKTTHKIHSYSRHAIQLKMEKEKDENRAKKNETKKTMFSWA